MLLACETRQREGVISELHLFANRLAAGALYASARQRLRQSRIDEELFDVLSGFEAIDAEGT